MKPKLKSTKFYILIGVIGILAVSSIFLSIESAVTGSTVAGLERQEKNLLAQNRDLEASLVKTLSNSELQEKSSELGFSKPTNLVYINDTAPVANLP